MRSLAELERDWTIDTIEDAHHWLDELELARSVANARDPQDGDD